MLSPLLKNSWKTQESLRRLPHRWRCQRRMRWHCALGQTTAEFILITATVAAIVFSIAFVNVKNAESTVALAAARTASAEWTSRNSSLAFTSVASRETEGGLMFVPKVMLTPKIYILASGARLTHAPDLEKAIVEKLRDTFAPNTTLLKEETCFRASYALYCTNLSAP